MLVAQNSLGPVCPVPLTVRGTASLLRRRVEFRRCRANFRLAIVDRRVFLRRAVSQWIVLFWERGLTKSTRRGREPLALVLQYNRAIVKTQDNLGRQSDARAKSRRRLASDL